MKKWIAVLLILCLMLSLCGFITKVTLQGSGTEKSPYLISNAKELRKAADLLSDKDTRRDYEASHFRLTADIDLGGKKWTPIFNFAGVFDGDGHTISGLKIKYSKKISGYTGSEAIQFGLFGKLSDATVRNLTISDSQITVTLDSGTVGTLAGYAMDAVVENCHISDSVTVSSTYKAGGLIGSASDGKIIDCTNAASVTSTMDNAGGIAGSCGFIQNCSNSGTITADNDAGGITSTLSGSAVNCENTGDIKAQDYAGGICANFGDGALNSQDNDNTVTIRDCTNSGSVSSESDPAGGITARASAGSIVDCVNTGAVTGSDAEAGGISGFFQPSPFGTPAETFSIENCDNSGAVTVKAKTANEVAGGILGMIYACDTKITIRGCTNSGSVNSVGIRSVLDDQGSAGGILGWGRVKNLTITDCENKGNIAGATYAGGIVGEVEPSEAESNASFLAENCRNSGSVTATYMESWSKDCYAGGILGFTRVEDSINGIIEDLKIVDCKNTGKLTCTGGNRHTDNLQAGE